MHSTWRTRHSDMMRSITARARKARLEGEPKDEVLWDIIPAEAMREGGELEVVRGSRGEVGVPDLQLGFPVPLPTRPANYQPCHMHGAHPYKLIGV